MSDGLSWAEGPDPRAWDEYLSASPHGHYQQSAIWGEAKQAGGWSCHREVGLRAGRIVGGYQLLTRPSRVGTIGYVYKGPVADRREDFTLVLGRLLGRARGRARAILLQPPDSLKPALACSCDSRLVRNELFPVIQATAVVELGDGIEAAYARMRRSTRVAIRRARARGVDVQEGNRDDLPAFFRFMLATCERQGVKPSPARLADLLSVWDALKPSGAIVLLLARCEGRSVAALIAIGFGSRLTLWKKGWSGEFPDRHPNALVMASALEWACHRRYRTADVAAIDAAVAQALLDGREPSSAHAAKHDLFCLGFGAVPKILPPSYLLISNPGWRAAYRSWVKIAASWRALRARG